MDVYNREYKCRLISAQMEYYDNLPPEIRKRIRERPRHASMYEMRSFLENSREINSRFEEINSMFEEGENNGI